MAEKTDMLRSANVTDGVERMRRFRKIILEHPRLKKIREKLIWLLATTEALVDDNEARRKAAKNRPIKLEELWCLPIIGPSGAMKSTSIRKIVDEINADESIPEDDIPVVVVSMREVKNTRAFLGVILEHYGDAAKDVVAKSGSVDAQMVARAIYHIAREKRTLVLILDEAHEMLRHDGGKLGKQMAMLLKTMTNEGCFSIVLLGTDELLQLFHISKELRNRCVPDEDVNLGAFDIAKAEDRKYLFKFLRRLDDAMVEHGVVERRLGWVDSLEDQAKIYDMCEGILGIACRIMLMALERALREGCRSVEWKHLESAFRAFNNIQKKPGYDPFAKGPQNETVGRLKAAAAKETEKRKPKVAA